MYEHIFNCRTYLELELRLDCFLKLRLFNTLLSVRKDYMYTRLKIFQVLSQKIDNFT